MATFEDFDEMYDNPEGFNIETGDDPGGTEYGELGLNDPAYEYDFTVSDDDLNLLEDRASEIDRSDVDKSQISFGRIMCPTRGGCQGATDCDYSYGSYPG